MKFGSSLNVDEEDEDDDDFTTKRMTRRTQVFMNPTMQQRLTLGHERLSQMADQSREQLLSKAMARRQGVTKFEHFFKI